MPTEVCTAEQFQCRDKQCIAGNKRCDGVNDCADGYDETACLYLIQQGTYPGWKPFEIITDYTKL